MWLQFGSVSGTQRILLSSAFSSRIRNSATGLTSIRQPGERRLRHDDHRVQRVPVGGERVAEEAVVGRVAERGEQQPVELDRPQLLVPLVLVRRPLGDLDDGVRATRRPWRQPTRAVAGDDRDAFGSCAVKRASVTPARARRAALLLPSSSASSPGSSSTGRPAARPSRASSPATRRRRGSRSSSTRATSRGRRRRGSAPCACSRVRSGSVPVSTNVLSAQRALAGRRALLPRSAGRPRARRSARASARRQLLVDQLRDDRPDPRRLGDLLRRARRAARRPSGSAARGCGP